MPFLIKPGFCSKICPSRFAVRRVDRPIFMMRLTFASAFCHCLFHISHLPFSRLKRDCPMGLQPFLEGSGWVKNKNAIREYPDGIIKYK